jgi:Fe-coproporphyrin III synthase
MIKRLLTRYTHKIHSLPIVVLMPHSSCNCRCVMCDIWKANSEKRELTVDDVSKHVHSFQKLGVREIVFSGGEALMHSNLWTLCKVLRSRQITLTLLTTGLLLERHAVPVVENFDSIIISIDGSSTVHDRIRNIPNGYEKITRGIEAIRRISSQYRITARCVLQRYNFFDFMNTVTSAKQIGIDQISFLPADISTSAFNHVSLTDDRIHEIALSHAEVNELEKILLDSFKMLAEAYRTKFIAESPAKMMRVVQYYRAINGEGNFSGAVCNAPWVSAVVESNGDVLPCFFHKPYGNIYDDDFTTVINSRKAVDFRKNLHMDTDAICKKCVCSLKLGIMQ